MTDESKDQKDEKREQEEEEKVEKSNFDNSLDALTETIKGFDISGLKQEISNVGSVVQGFESRLKALEEPTNLDVKPKTDDDEDIGAEVKTPDTYQSNSNQAGIKESDAENAKETDKNNLSMQEKSINQSEQVFTTETPRPGAALETVEKSGIQLNDVLKASREAGHADLGSVGRRILKGEFGAPEGSESQW